MDASHHATAKQPLLGMTLDELKQLARELGMPSFAAKQIDRRDDQPLESQPREAEG